MYGEGSGVGGTGGEVGRRVLVGKIRVAVRVLVDEGVRVGDGVSVFVDVGRGVRVAVGVQVAGKMSPTDVGTTVGGLNGFSATCGFTKINR